MTRKKEEEISDLNGNNNEKGEKNLCRNSCRRMQERKKPEDKSVE